LWHFVGMTIALQAIAIEEEASAQVTVTSASTEMPPMLAEA